MKYINDLAVRGCGSIVDAHPHGQSASLQSTSYLSFNFHKFFGGSAVIFSIPEEAVRTALANPIVMVASDGSRITGPKIHPRGQATFARVLGRYVRDEKTLTLMTALRKMTLMPAQRLEKRASEFKDKGRIRIGADADITIFDPARVIDKATFDEPLQYSEGIPFVLVNGVAVVKNGELVRGSVSRTRCTRSHTTMRLAVLRLTHR